MCGAAKIKQVVIYREATFGSWLRKRRQRLDLTQADLAKLVGCSAITIRKIESDERAPSRQLADLLANCLEIPSTERPAFIAFARGRQPAAAEPLPARAQLAQPPAAPPSHELPVVLTDLLGREQETATIVQRLRDDQARLLTIVGPPGIGKTRLSLQVIAALKAAEGQFSGGVFFVSLAELQEPALLAATIAQALRLPDPGQQTPLEHVCIMLKAERALLVLDNFEHLLAAAPQLVRILAACPGVKVLATSRSALRMRGEQIFAVAPLGLPDLSAPLSAEQAARAPAVQLFIERTQALVPGFALSDANAATIAAICARLDGLPLAIELAAARSRLLPPQALLNRLSQRLLQLSDSYGDLPTRQQTLRAAMEWSYHLLTADEQRLFTRLGVFVGDYSLEALEAICEADDGRPSQPLLDTLDQLVGHSLVVQRNSAESEPRFTMLEIIRAYALERLEASGELGPMRTRHAAYYIRLVEQLGELTGSQQSDWLSRLEQELGAIRATLTWCGEHHLEAGLALVGQLKLLWLTHAHRSEGLSWLRELLARTAERPVAPEALALALANAGQLALHNGDFDESAAYLGQSLRHYQQLEYEPGIVQALRHMGLVAYYRGDYTSATHQLSASLHLARELDDTLETAAALSNLGLVAKDRGDYTQAIELFEESLALYRQAGQTRSVALALNSLAAVAYWQGHYGQAAELASQALALYRQLHDKNGCGYTLDNLGMALFRQGQVEAALPLLREALALFRELRSLIGEALLLNELGWVFHSQGDAQQAAQCQYEGLRVAQQIGERPAAAARLLAAAEALRAKLGAPIATAELPAHARLLGQVRGQIDPADWAALWAEGQAQPIEQIVAQAFADAQ
jgi:predicted ATPase/DNA-binding XRE family transcriptional regulator